MNILHKFRRRIRRLWNYRRIATALRGKHGLEVGGPSALFSPETPNGYIPAIYAIAASIDNCNFATSTTWSQGDGGRTFQYLPGRQPGLQYIHDATDLASIEDRSYDFLMASHILEHVANPLRALAEFRRVLKPDGKLLLLVPKGAHTFDHRRPPTTFAHLEQDLAKGTDEGDTTHLDEILKLHDLELDPLAGTPEQFRARSLRNLENRCLHHHVFSPEVLMQAVRASHFKPLAIMDAWPPHIILLARCTYL